MKYLTPPLSDPNRSSAHFEIGFWGLDAPTLLTEQGDQSYFVIL